MKRIRVAIIYGGRSSEHEVSLRSARSIVEHIDRSRYDLILIGIDPSGRWYRHSEQIFWKLTQGASPDVKGGGQEVTLPPSPGGPAIIPLPPDNMRPSTKIDVVFPVLHGPYGEDGTVQGLLELAGLPYVGAGVLGSALGMDKDVQKRLLRAADIPVVEFTSIRRSDWNRNQTEGRTQIDPFGLPVFVKPANLGSSVGITRVSRLEELDGAIAEAFAYDDKIIVERGIDAREIECAVLGGDNPEASIPGEVCPKDGFYSYTAKYLDEHGAKFEIPAKLSPKLAEQVQALSIRSFRTIECHGMARVDFLLERTTDRLFVNELNTIPGFTAISQYPILWEASGLPYVKLIDRLISLALERDSRRKQLRTRYIPPSHG